MRILLATLIAFGTTAQAQVKEIPNLIAAQQQTLLKEYLDFLAIPNIMGDSVNIHRNAAFIKNMMQQRGIKTEVLTLPVKGASPWCMARCWCRVPLPPLASMRITTGSP